MHIAATVPLPASPPRIWDLLLNPAAASACVPGLRSWEEIQPTNHYRLWLNWHDAPAGVPINLIWETLNPPTDLTIRAEVEWGSTAVPVTGTIQLVPITASATDLNFRIDLHTTNKLIMQMAANIIPKTADAFFTCMKRQLLI